LGESPSYDAIENLHRFVQFLVRWLFIDVGVNICPLLLQISDQFFITKLSRVLHYGFNV
jgi:hypothetical protein